MKFAVKIVNENFRRLGSWNCPRHKLVFEANDRKDAWQKSFSIVKDFNDKGGIVKTGYVGDDKSQWANWKISDVVKV